MQSEGACLKRIKTTPGKSNYLSSIFPSARTRVHQCRPCRMPSNSCRQRRFWRSPAPRLPIRPRLANGASIAEGFTCRSAATALPPERRARRSFLTNPIKSWRLSSHRLKCNHPKMLAARWTYPVRRPSTRPAWHPASASESKLILHLHQSVRRAPPRRSISIR